MESQEARQCDTKARELAALAEKSAGDLAAAYALLAIYWQREAERKSETRTEVRVRRRF